MDFIQCGIVCLLLSVSLPPGAGETPRLGHDVYNTFREMSEDYGHGFLTKTINNNTLFHADVREMSYDITKIVEDLRSNFSEMRERLKGLASEVHNPFASKDCCDDQSAMEMRGDDRIPCRLNVTVKDNEGLTATSGNKRFMASWEPFRSLCGSNINKLWSNYPKESEVQQSSFPSLGKTLRSCMNSSSDMVLCLHTQLSTFTSLLPIPTYADSFVFIVDANQKLILITKQKDLNNTKLLERMALDKEGQFQEKRLISYGFSKEGVIDYTWREIPGTNLTVCLCHCLHDPILTLSTNNTTSQEKCEESQGALILLTTDAYIDPLIPRDSSATLGSRPLVELQRDGNTSANKYKKNIKPLARLAHAAVGDMNAKFRAEERNTPETNTPERVYVGFIDGLYVTFPRVGLISDYDHARQTWYIFARLEPDKLIFTQKRSVITISQAVNIKGASDDDPYPVGVFGLELNLTTFGSLLRQKLHGDCFKETMGTRCLLIDQSGYLVFPVNPSGRTHLSDSDKPTVDLLQEKGLMSHQYCHTPRTGLAELEWRVSVNNRTAFQNNSYIENVPGTNIYLLNITTERKNCSCKEQEPADICNQSQNCNCPCQQAISTSQYEPCTQSHRSKEDIYPVDAGIMPPEPVPCSPTYSTTTQRPSTRDMSNADKIHQSSGHNRDGKNVSNNQGNVKGNLVTEQPTSNNISLGGTEDKKEQQRNENTDKMYIIMGATIALLFTIILCICCKLLWNRCRQETGEENVAPGSNNVVLRSRQKHSIRPNSYFGARIRQFFGSRKKRSRRSRPENIELETIPEDSTYISWDQYDYAYQSTRQVHFQEPQGQGTSSVVRHQTNPLYSPVESVSSIPEPPTTQEQLQTEEYIIPASSTGMPIIYSLHAKKKPKTATANGDDCSRGSQQDRPIEQKIMEPRSSRESPIRRSKDDHESLYLQVETEDVERPAQHQINHEYLYMSCSDAYDGSPNEQTLPKTVVPCNKKMVRCVDIDPKEIIDDAYINKPRYSKPPSSSKEKKCGIEQQARQNYYEQLLPSTEREIWEPCINDHDDTQVKKLAHGRSFGHEVIPKDCHGNHEQHQDLHRSHSVPLENGCGCQMHAMKPTRHPMRPPACLSNSRDCSCRHDPQFCQMQCCKGNNCQAVPPYTRECQCRRPMHGFHSHNGGLPQCAHSYNPMHFHMGDQHLGYCQCQPLSPRHLAYHHQLPGCMGPCCTQPVFPHAPISHQQHSCHLHGRRDCGSHQNVMCGCTDERQISRPIQTRHYPYDHSNIPHVQQPDSIPASLPVLHTNFNVRHSSPAINRPHFCTTDSDNGTGSGTSSIRTYTTDGSEDTYMASLREDDQGGRKAQPGTCFL